MHDLLQTLHIENHSAENYNYTSPVGRVFDGDARPYPIEHGEAIVNINVLRIRLNVSSRASSLYIQIFDVCRGA